MGNKKKNVLYVSGSSIETTNYSPKKFKSSLKSFNEIECQDHGDDVGTDLNHDFITESEERNKNEPEKEQPQLLVKNPYSSQSNEGSSICEAETQWVVRDCSNSREEQLCKILNIFNFIKKTE